MEPILVVERWEGGEGRGKGHRRAMERSDGSATTVVAVATVATTVAVATAVATAMVRCPSRQLCLSYHPSIHRPPLPRASL